MKTRRRRALRYNSIVFSLMEPTAIISNIDLNHSGSKADKSIFVMDDEGHHHKNLYRRSIMSQQPP